MWICTPAQDHICGTNPTGVLPSPLLSLVQSGVNAPTAVVCSEEFQRAQLELREMVLYQTDPESLQLTLNMQLVNRKCAPAPHVSTEHSADVHSFHCENNTDGGQMQMKAKPCRLQC